MGYYKPIYVYGVDRFLADALAAGGDGLIVVDLPPEEDDELCLPALKVGLDFIRLATPTTDEKRLPAVLKHTAGFVYYVSITGITGPRRRMPPRHQGVAAYQAAYRPAGGCGLGVRTPEQARAIAAGADAVVVGSALVEAVRTSLDGTGAATPADGRSRSLPRRARSRRRRARRAAPVRRLKRWCAPASGRSVGPVSDRLHGEPRGRCVSPRLPSPTHIRR